MSKIRSSLLYSTLDSYVSVVLQLASTVVLARLLTPQETGTFAVAMVFASLASTFRDFGVTEYLIMERQLDDDKLRAAFTVNLAVSWLMATSMFLAAPSVAAFYRSEEILLVMRVLAANFVLIPFGAVAIAWFRREMSFRPIFIINVCANFVQFGVATSLALTGHGVMSLAWASLANVAASVIGSVLMRPKSFPKWPGRRGVAQVLHFGKFASGIYIFGQLGKGAPEMIIGRAQDMAAVGMFSRGAGLVEVFHRLVLRAVMPVCLPYFAQAVREESTPRRGFVRTIALLTGIGWPFLACIGLAAYAAVRLMYGDQWFDAVPLAQILCLVAAVELLYYPAKEALLSMGCARESNRLQMSTQALRAIGLLAVVPWGLKGACWGLLAGTILGAVHSHWELHGRCQITWSDVQTGTIRSLVAALCAAAPLILWLVWRPINADNYLQVAALAALACPLCWAAGLYFFKHPLWAELCGLMRAVRSRLRGGAAA